jgi:phospho-N-acetylmuramoyl-pentapeptide-transferase
VTVLLVPFLTALALAVAIGNPAITALRRLKAQQIISSDAPQRHQAKAGTPSMGGLIFVLAGLVAALLVGKPTPGLIALVLLTLACTGIGFLDDFLIVRRGKNLGLKARQKLALQGIVAIVFAVWVAGTRSQEAAAGGALPTPYASLIPAVFHVLLIVALSNAVNLTDGLDGLASGLAVPLWLVLAVIGWIAPQITTARFGWDHGVEAFCAALAGACLGFLWFNAHPATVFMGDTGSLALGGAMAGAAILLRAEWALLLAGAVYLAEMFSVMLQVASFKTTGRRIFRMSPLHHHFELVGWAETKIVARFTLLGVACAALTLVWVLR